MIPDGLSYIDTQYNYDDLDNLNEIETPNVDENFWIKKQKPKPNYVR